MVKEIFLFVKEQVISLLLSSDYFMLGQLWLVWIPASLLIPVLWKIDRMGAIRLCCVGTSADFTGVSEDKFWATTQVRFVYTSNMLLSFVP